MPLQPRSVRVAVALPLAAPVEQEHAVALADQQPRRLLRPLAAGEGDHRRTVLGGNEPAVEAQPVARGEGDILVWGAQLRGRHVGAPRVGDDVRLAEREHHERKRHEERKRQSHAPRVAPDDAPTLPRPPECHEANAGEQRTGRDHQEPREVVAGRAVLAGVVAGLAGAHHDHEDPDVDRQDPAKARAEPRIAPGERHEQRNLYEPAPQVVASRNARLRLEEVVVHHVERADAQRDPGKPVSVRRAAATRVAAALLVSADG